MRDTAAACGVALVTGDTKVVDRGKGDGLFITTSGIGRIPPGVDSAPGTRVARATWCWCPATWAGTAWRC